MEICIWLTDATSVESLRERLVGVFGASSVSLDARRREVRVRADAASDRSVVRAIGAVQAWLADHSLNSALLRLGTHACTLHGAAYPASAGPRPEYQPRSAVRER